MQKQWKGSEAQGKGVRDARPVWKVGLEGNLESDCRQPRVPGTSPRGSAYSSYRNLRHQVIKYLND